MPKQVTTPIYYLLALICVVFVFSVGVANLKTDPIENDEFRTLNHIEPVWLSQTRTIPETIKSVSLLSPQHGPLYFIILNVWRKLVGSDLFSLRFLSTLFGVLSIAMVYRLAIITGKRQDGITAALALSFLAFYVFHVHYLRMYTLLTLACGYVLYSYWSLSQARSASRWNWISLFAASALMSYIHYMGSLVMLAIGIYHIFLAPRNRRWWLVLAVLALAGLMFLPWLPVVYSGLAQHKLDATAIRLPPLEAIRATLSVNANGILVLPPLVAGLIMVNVGRISRAEKYLVFVAAATLVSLALLNHFAPIFVANRMRYLLVLTIPYCCLAAIAFRWLPSSKLLRVAVAAIWCMSFFYYVRSEDYLTFTNIVQHETEKIPNYQTFVYESHKLPGHNELILSFHPNMKLSSNKTLPYYRKIIPRWAYIVHMTYDSQGDLVIQSGHTKYGSLEAIAENSTGIWVLHNPRETDLMSLPVFENWFLQHFKMCRRYVEQNVSIIDYYVKLSIPCNLIAAETPNGISYANGTELANYVIDLGDGELKVYLWWRRAINREYSFSVQVFDESFQRHQQHDQVISGEPIDVVIMDVSSLPEGEYTVQFIVYDFESKQSQPGKILPTGLGFERATDLYAFTISL